MKKIALITCIVSSAVGMQTAIGRRVLTHSSKLETMQSDIETLMQQINDRDAIIQTLPSEKTTDQIKIVNLCMKNMKLIKEVVKKLREQDAILIKIEDEKYFL